MRGVLTRCKHAMCVTVAEPRWKQQGLPVQRRLATLGNMTSGAVPVRN